MSKYIFRCFHVFRLISIKLVLTLLSAGPLWLNNVSSNDSRYKAIKPCLVEVRWPLICLLRALEHDAT